MGKIRRGLCKCYHCRKEWSRRRGSRFEKSRVPYQKVLLAIKLFELETSVRKASKQLGLPTIRHTHFIISLGRSSSPSLGKTNGSPVRLKLMKVTSEGGEKVNVVGELPTRSRYSGSWNVGGKYESMLLRMLRVTPSSILP